MGMCLLWSDVQPLVIAQFCAFLPTSYPGTGPGVPVMLPGSSPGRLGRCVGQLVTSAGPPLRSLRRYSRDARVVRVVTRDELEDKSTPVPERRSAGWRLRMIFRSYLMLIAARPSVVRVNRRGVLVGRYVVEQPSLHGRAETRPPGAFRRGGTYSRLFST